MEDLLEEIVKQDNDNTIRTILTKQKTKSKSQTQKLRKKIALLNSTKQTIRFRLKLGIPPSFTDINAYKFKTLTNQQKLQFSKNIEEMNLLLLEQTNEQIRKNMLLFSNHTKPNSKPPDLNNKYTNFREWNYIEKWIKTRPLTEETTSPNFQPLITARKLHGFDKNTTNTIRKIISNINLSQSKIDVTTTTTTTTIYADQSQEFLFKKHSNGIFSISKDTNFTLPPNIIKGLTFGLNFVPTSNKYPIKSIDDTFSEFEHRLKWKFFWYHKDKNNNNTEKKSSILPLALRKNLKTTPPENTCLKHYVSQIKNDFQEEANAAQNIPEPAKITARAINNTIKFFRSRRKDIVLKPADKGSSTVIMDKNFYTNNINNYIQSNHQYFKEIEHDPTPDLLVKITKDLIKLKYTGSIDNRTLRLLTPNQTEARCPYLYGLPKIHKLPVTFRPIVSGNGHPTEKLSIFIDFLLQPYVALNDFFLKDSTDLLKTLEPIKNLDQEKTILFSLDVVSMYTNIPLDELINSIMDTIYKNPNDFLRHKNITYNPTLVEKLLELTLFNNFFQFNNKYYQQIHGIAMGTPCACSTSDIFICNWIKQAFSSMETKPFLYKQYRDDGFGIWQGPTTELLKFVEKLNQMHPTLKFTVTYGKQIDYLDLTISINNFGSISTETYYKPTDSFAYLHSESNHPKHCITNIALSQAIRHIRNCSNYSTYLFHTQFLKHNLIQKGHNYRSVTQKIRKVKFYKRTQLLNYTKQRKLTRTPIIVTYNQNMPNIKQIIKKHTNNLLDQDNLEAIGGNPIIGYKVQKSLGASIIRAKL